jgi:hypothetical protein
MSGGNLETRSECFSDRCWRAGDAARQVNLLELGGSQFETF